MKRVRVQITREEAWRLLENALTVVGTPDAAPMLGYAARLIGSDEFEALARFTPETFAAFCTARTLGASDEALRAMLKVQRRPSEGS